MPRTVNNNGTSRLAIPLEVKPHKHQGKPSITGRLFSKEAGTVLHGHYNMDYLLPGGDHLRLLANHNKKTVQIIWLTHHPNKIRRMPTNQNISLVSIAIKYLHRYYLRSNKYKKPLSKIQLQKKLICKDSIRQLKALLNRERRIEPKQYIEQEKLRRQVIDIIEACRNKNFILANNPAVSEGELEKALYQSLQKVQSYTFNRAHAVSKSDQMIFSSSKKEKNKQYYIWDSHIHIGNNEQQLKQAVQEICRQYQLNSNTAPLTSNRFHKYGQFLKKLWLDGKDWMDYLAIIDKPRQIARQEKRQGLTITNVMPYYRLQGLKQKRYSNIESLVNSLVGPNMNCIESVSPEDAIDKLTMTTNHSWTATNNTIFLKKDNLIQKIKYFQDKEGRYIPLPSENDLSSLCMISQRHLYWPHRVKLQFKAFLSRVPEFFKNFFRGIKHFISKELKDDFKTHIHLNHAIHEKQISKKHTEQQSLKSRVSLKNILLKHGLMKNGQTIKDFIDANIHKNHYIVADIDHPPTPLAFENPLHRAFNIVHHIGKFFVDTSEQNPMIGTLAFAAYFYGGGAVLAPEKLKALLTKLHLKGLIKGIEPTQKLGYYMSKGLYSQAISASVTYWQGVTLAGDLDRFFIQAITKLKDSPAEVAIITSLAMSLGYGLCEGIPSLKEEMGVFPYTNYLTAGAKGGAAIYDTIMHPGDDWLLGTTKWLLRIIMSGFKMVLSPFIEGKYYGFKDGFLKGWIKSAKLFMSMLKGFIGALSDIVLLSMKVVLSEVLTFTLYIPFKGLSLFFSKLIHGLGHLKALGQALLEFSSSCKNKSFLPGFRLSPLYGFHSPIQRYHSNGLINAVTNSIMIIVSPVIQLIKNVLILPIIDTLSFITRLSLEVFVPLIRGTSYALGKAIKAIGFIWDNSIGFLFRNVAKGFLNASQFIIRKCGKLRQWIVSGLQIARKSNYEWAFKDSKIKLPENKTSHYFLNKPIRMEKIPHSHNDCLLKNLMDQKDSAYNLSPREKSLAMI